MGSDWLDIAGRETCHSEERKRACPESAEGKNLAAHKSITLFYVT